MGLSKEEIREAMDVVFNEFSDFEVAVCDFTGSIENFFKGNSEMNPPSYAVYYCERQAKENNVEKGADSSFVDCFNGNVNIFRKP